MIVRALIFALMLASFARTAEAQRLRVRVVDVSGDRAYLEPGAERGVRRGARVRIGRQNFRVAATTSSYAVIEIGDNQVSVGDTGTTQRSSRTSEDGPTRLPAPEPLETFEDQWTPAPRPAAEQRPNFVPLSSALSSRRVNFDLRSSTVAVVPLSGEGPTLVKTQLRGRVDAQLIRDVPLRLSADAALQLYFGDMDQRRASASRPVLVARQLQLSYGEDRSFYAAIGRLRQASSSVGMLDGARIQTPSFGGGFQIAAFGGVVPEPDAGIPAFDTSRFGIELSYRDPESPLRPSASLVAHGSTFDGGLDEQRLSGRLRLMPGTVSVGAQAELSFFGSDNPFGAPVAQLFMAGADVSGQHGGFRWGLRGDYRVPERSRWLASFLPPGYFCVGVANTDPLSTECTSANDARYSGTGDVEMRWSKLAIGATASYLTAPENDADQLVAMAHVRAVDLGGIMRVGVSGSVTRGSLMDAYSGRLGVGASLLRGKLDLDVHYRPTLRLYTADIVSGWDHRVGGQVYVSWDPQWQIVVGADALLGRDVEALLVQTHVVWRPQFGAD